MCGIAGVLDPSSLPDEDALRRMNDCLAHRGPDDAGIHVDEPVALAHRRLSIIDPESGQQPMFNEDRSVAVVFNGEIYNHRELRDELASSHTFRTDADTEVLVHLYEEHGPSFVERLDGMFAFALWDTDRERLVLARDRMGIKPLVLARDGDRLAFASELPALFEPDIDLGGLDRAALGTYFCLGFAPAPRTAFRNVRKLRPGELAVVECADGGRDEGSLSVDRRRYYRPSIEPRDPSIDTAATELRRRVERAVERRLMSDVPLGAFLSGGLDSSIVVGTMADLLDEPVRTFTVGFDEARFDESWAAREVADHHDTDHHEYTVTPDDVRETIPGVLDRLGEPFADPSLIPTSVVARETARDVTVALSGDGADELFAGYSKYRGEHLSTYYRALPGPVRGAVDRLLGAAPVDRTSRVGELGRQARKFRRGSEPDPVARHLAWLRLPDADAARAVAPLDPERRARADLEDAHRDARRMLPGGDAFGRMLAVDTRFGLPNQMLHKVDLAGMYSSLEVRVPFLDRAVVEYALSLPTGQKITAREQKRVLRRAFDDVLPERIRQRGKQGFDMPVGEWLTGPLAGDFRGALESIRAPFLDRGAVREVFDAHREGRADHAKFLWSVYVYGRWERRLREEGVPLGLDG
ncbi:asparagine synthase (glutamine-hydrolyzing) [Haloglomus litoreum]|uniref:asparagine synthase (glutamine-hydrolyzing) n=1 Tax=Haloglomus litoreum TaxID=3034026 RepID=UPI0023E85DA3|nr:asparagine synthase (glutamine-hydrolyzing) [Haloglomus sp. DT116]